MYKPCVISICGENRGSYILPTSFRNINILRTLSFAGAWKEDGPRITSRVFELLDSTDWEGRQGGFLAAKVRTCALFAMQFRILLREPFASREEGHLHL